MKQSGKILESYLEDTTTVRYYKVCWVESKKNSDYLSEILS